MSGGWYARAGLVFLVVIGAGFLLYPSYYYYYDASTEERDNHEAFCAALPDPFNCSKFNLGLDLQGGVHLVMGVRVEKALEHRADRLSDSLREALGEEEIAFSAINRPRGTADIVIELANDEAADKLGPFIRRDFSVLEIARTSGLSRTLRLIEDEATFVRDSAVEQAIKTIRNRADKLGVSEPTIARRGTDGVLIQLPGVKDPQRAIDIIGRTAQLAFHIVDYEATAVFDDIEVSELPEGVERREGNVEGAKGEPVRNVYFDVPDDARDTVRELLESKLPSNRILAFGEIRERGKEVEGMFNTFVLDGKAGITGDYLTDAQARPDPELPSNYYVTMDFDTKGAKIFADLTEANVNEYMAVVLDGVVNSAPRIQEKIGGGTARITLGSAQTPREKFEEAKALSIVLKAGALPAPVEIREKRQVGKLLGEDAVRMGRQSIALGGLLVLIFMLIYYRGSGVIADFALVLNVILVLSILALFEATLTLPGMAGILLTIGMAVDANVIIFERIREELRLGKTPRAAIESGYSRAFWTIVDANVTTLIAGVVLMEYGSGPVKGFAVTLIVGILCSMFTAIFVTRIIYDFFASRRRLRTLSI